MKKNKKVETQEEAFSYILDKAQWDPTWFFENVLMVKPTSQQRDASNELIKLMKAKLKVSDFHKGDDHYVKFYKTKPSKEEMEYASKLGLSIMSGNGTGKDAWLSWVVIWFLFCFDGSKILVTAPTQDQLRAVLWAEIGRWLDERADDGDYRFILRDLYEMNASYVYLKAKNEKGKIKQNFASARTATIKPDGESEALAGTHAEFMLLLVDEASGVPEAVYKPIERTMTGACNLCILIFNPTKRTGYAIDTHYGDKKDKYVGLHWDARDSENVNKQHIENIKTTYGENSNQYRISVLGLPPLIDENTLIHYDWASYAMERMLEGHENPIAYTDQDPLIVSCDVARLGKNKAIILVRKGPIVIDIREIDKCDTVELTYECQKVLFEYDDYNACYIDICGVGGGVYDQLKKIMPRVYGVDAGASATEERFHRLKDQLWWRLRDTFEARRIGFAICIAKYKREKLLREVSDIRLSKSMQTGSNKIKIESKQDMKLRNVASPDYGEALMLSYYREDIYYYKQNSQYKDAYDKARALRDSKAQIDSKNSWLGV